MNKLLDRVLTMNRPIIALLAVLLALGGVTIAEEKPEPDPTVSGENEIYIPKDLSDCFVQLEKQLKPTDIEKMKNGTESAMAQYHFGLGMWMRNNWGLWRGSRLAGWFNMQGIQHPDDMSGIILHSFWRHLNGQPLKLEEQVKYYQDYWKKVKESQQSH